MKQMLLLLAVLLLVLFIGCENPSYAQLGVANLPMAWRTLVIPFPSDRLNWSLTQLALNSDTWVFSDINTEGVDNYTRFLTFENPNGAGVAPFVDIEILDDDPAVGNPYSDYVVRFGTYKLINGRNNPSNRMEIYVSDESSFRFTQRTNPYERGSGDDTFGALLEHPRSPYQSTWILDQTSGETALSIDVGTGARTYTRLDSALDTIQATPTLLAQYLHVFLQAAQVLHSGWNGYGQQYRHIASVIGSIISSGGLDEEYRVRYNSPLGLGFWHMEYTPAFPPLPTAKISEAMEFDIGYQVVSHIFTQSEANDTNDWHLEIGSGSGTGKLGGSVLFQVVGYDGAVSTGYDASLEFGEIKTVGDTSTDVVDMLIAENFSIVIDGVSTPVPFGSVAPGSLDLRW